MAKYRVLLNGQNFLLDVDGEVGRHGFFTTRFVEAQDLDAAVETAIEHLRRERDVDNIGLNGSDDPPRVVAEKIEEIPSFDGVESPSPGLAFYSEDSES